MLFPVNSVAEPIENQVVAVLAERIVQAHKEVKPFLAVIVIPLKPEFPGEWNESDQLQSVAYLNYATILRAKDSLFARLIANGGHLRGW